MIPATDFPEAGIPPMGSSVFSNAASISDRSRDSVNASFVRSAVRWPLVSSVPKLAHATVKNTQQHRSARGNHAIATQCLVKNVPSGHLSCHMQVSSVLQQYMVGDLLLVAIDIRHHDSHHKIVLEEKLF